MKKFISILAAGAVSVGLIPTTFATGTDGLTSEEIVVNENSGNSTFLGTEAGAKWWYPGNTSSANATDGKMLEYTSGAYGSTDTVVKMTYTPTVAIKGTYEVFVNIPEQKNSGFTATINHNGKSDSVKFSEYLGYGKYHSIGAWDFSGEDDENVVLSYGPANTKSFSGSTSWWTGVFDSVKFVKTDSIIEEINSVVMEEDGIGYVNGSDNATAVGYVNISGTESFGGVNNCDLYVKNHGDLSGGTAFSTLGGNSNASDIKVTYYPKLNAGKYKVSVYTPFDNFNQYSAGLSINTSCGGDTVNTYGRHTSKQYLEIGTFSFSGIYGDDFVEVSRQPNVSTGMNDAWEAVIDNLKFEKVDDRAGVWDFESSTSTEVLGTHTWPAPVLGTGVLTDEIGMVGNGYTIKKEDGLTGIKIGKLPSEILGFRGLSVSAWVRPDGFSWYQHVFNLYDDTNKKDIFRVDYENGDLKSYMTEYNHTAAGTTTNPEPGSWHMITAVMDVSKVQSTWGNCYTLSLFYDGVLVGSRTISQPDGPNLTNGFPEGTALYFGERADGTDVFNGGVDELKVYNVALTAEETKNLYNSYFAPIASLSDGSISMTSGTALGSDNSITINVEGGVNTNIGEYTEQDTVNNVFENSMIRMENIPSGLYVSSMFVAGNNIMISFGGNATDAVGMNSTINAWVLAGAGNYNCNSGILKVAVNSSFAMGLAEGSIKDDNTYVGYLKNNSYSVDSTIDIVVGVYGVNNTLKSVSLLKDKVVPGINESMKIETEALNYSDGDTVKVFALTSIDSLTPINAYLQ